MTKTELRKINRTLAKSVKNFKPPENLTLSEWSDKYRRLSTESSAEAGPWRTSRTPYLKEPMDAFTDPKIERIVMVAASQVGKALDITTPIATPDGWTTMEHLKIGDTVFDEHGNQCKVTNATEIMYNRKCYRVTFSDGSVITADAKHQWYVESILSLSKGVYNGVLTTDQIAATYKHKNRNRYAIPVSGALQCESRELPVPPYTLGYWLGDGNSYSSQITVHKDDLEIADYIRSEGIRIKVRKVEENSNVMNIMLEPKIRTSETDFCIRGHNKNLLGRTKKGLCAECTRQSAMKYKWGHAMDPVVDKTETMHSKLRKLELLNNKHIPDIYLRSSYNQRLSLLQGILDSDGSIDKRGSCEITLKSGKLIEDIHELLISLGIKNSIHNRKVVCTSSNSPTPIVVYRISFMVYDIPVFRLKRKKERIKSRFGTGLKGCTLRTSETERRRIVNVEETESVPVKCVEVDSPSHLYLAGTEMIPTHNSEFELNAIAYIIDQDPGSIMYIQPTLEDAQKFSRLRIAPLIRDNKCLRRKVADSKAKDSGNTILQKSFPGGMLTITGSNSASALASTPARYVIGDERDRWAASAGTEGDPWKLAEARQTTFYNRKSIEVSTPTIKGMSNIEASFTEGTQERWCAECPHCGEYSDIVFERIKFTFKSEKIRGKNVYNVDDNISYSCPHCGALSSEKEMRDAPHKWIAENPAAYEKGIRSFWLNAFSSPWTPWKKIVTKFLDSKDDPEKLKVVFNTLFGELWEDRIDDSDEETLMNRREDYAAELPEGVLCLTCGVDTQDNRLEYEVVGYGLYNESWGIKKGYIMGKPDSDEVWQQLDDIVDHVYKFRDGKGLKISITCIDSGGHYTQEIYKRARERLNKKVFAIKGQGGDGVPFVKPPTKVAVKDNKKITCWLYTLGVDAGKESIMSSVQVQEPGPKYCHFPKDESRGYDEYFFNGLLSERLEQVKSRTGTKWAWVKLPGHNRNEALDCRNYANAGLKIIDPDMFALEQRLKNLPDKSQETQKPAQVQSRQKPVRRKTTVNRIYDDW